MSGRGQVGHALVQIHESEEKANALANRGFTGDSDKIQNIIILSKHNDYSSYPF